MASGLAAPCTAVLALVWACRVRGRRSEALEHVRAGLRTAAIAGNRLTHAWIVPSRGPGLDALVDALLRE